MPAYDCYFQEVKICICLHLISDVLLENIWRFCNLFCSVMGQMNALKHLGLDVAKGTVLTDGPVKQTKFFITRL
jgi:hypothetical protein